MSRLTFALTIGILFSSQLFSQTENSLTRNEVSVLKKKLQGVFDALGKPPEGYMKEEEDFYLPTESYKTSAPDFFQPLTPSVTYRFGGASEKKAKKSSKEFEKEYRKKMAEAQAKGDVQEMTRITQELQKKMGEMQLEAEESTKEPIEVSIRFNSNPSQQIDPDGVLFENQGVIALRLERNEGEESSRVAVFFDPVSLKDTKNLSRVEMKLPDEGVKEKTKVLSATIELNGPADLVEAWVKTLAVKKVFAQIDVQ